MKLKIFFLLILTLVSTASEFPKFSQTRSASQRNVVWFYFDHPKGKDFNLKVDVFEGGKKLYSHKGALDKEFECFTFSEKTFVFKYLKPYEIHFEYEDAVSKKTFKEKINYTRNLLSPIYLHMLTQEHKAEIQRTNYSFSHLREEIRPQNPKFKFAIKDKKPRDIHTLSCHFKVGQHHLDYILSESLFMLKIELQNEAPKEEKLLDEMITELSFRYLDSRLYFSEELKDKPNEDGSKWRPKDFHMKFNFIGMQNGYKTYLIQDPKRIDWKSMLKVAVKGKTVAFMSMRRPWSGKVTSEYYDHNSDWLFRKPVRRRDRMKKP